MVVGGEISAIMSLKMLRHVSKRLPPSLLKSQCHLLKDLFYLPKEDRISDSTEHNTDASSDCRMPAQCRVLWEEL